MPLVSVLVVPSAVAQRVFRRPMKQGRRRRPSPPRVQSPQFLAATVAGGTPGRDTVPTDVEWPPAAAALRADAEERAAAPVGHGRRDGQQGGGRHLAGERRDWC